MKNHADGDLKDSKSSTDVLARTMNHALYCYFRTVMLVIPFVTMVPFKNKNTKKNIIN